MGTGADVAGAPSGRNDEVLIRHRSRSRRRSVYRGPELGRRIVGALFEVGIKAYGTAAAVSVAFSDSETVGGKCNDAIAAVPNLMDRYHEAQYAIDHGQEIRTALDYVHQHAPDPEQLDSAAHRASETLVGIQTTYDEVVRAKDSLGTFNVFESVPEAARHLGNAWAARPDLDSIRHLAGIAEDITPVVRQVDVLSPRFYDGLLTVVDNFASDEIAATLGVMGTALAVAFVLGRGVGFWARRGRPGVIAGTLQRVGARLFHGWYVRNLDVALGPSLYDAARERIRSDIVEDPETTLDPDALRRLERYFERRTRTEVVESAGPLEASGTSAGSSRDAGSGRGRAGR